uniref:Uncharacterized protein n=1 Tax=Oryza brachyantha TaxID=4533 RepID=J3M9X4_ORYBR
MVVRFSPQPYYLQLPTTAFRVFQRKDSWNGGGAAAEHSWSELPGLDGRMLFVGRGCSRSYEAAGNYPGYEGVYFLDDRSYHDTTILCGKSAERQFPFSDNGKWSEEEEPPRIEGFFPEPSLSNYSPPVWILP